MAVMTPEAWAAAVAAQAVTDGIHAGKLANGAPCHYRQAISVKNKAGVVVKQDVIDIRDGGFSGGPNGTHNV
jgi:hypothetical protein